MKSRDARETQRGIPVQTQCNSANKVSRERLTLLAVISTTALWALSRTSKQNRVLKGGGRWWDEKMFVFLWLSYAMCSEFLSKSLWYMRLCYGEGSKTTGDCGTGWRHETELLACPALFINTLSGPEYRAGWCWESRKVPSCSERSWNLGISRQEIFTWSCLETNFIIVAGLSQSFINGAALSSRVLFPQQLQA